MLNNVTGIALKKEFIIFGDSDGNLNKWNIKTKSLNLIASKLGNIKQLKFSNRLDLILLISLADSVLVFDVTKSLIMSSYKITNKIEINYSDWYCDDKIIIKLSNNITKILNLELKQFKEENIDFLSLSSFKIFSTSLDYLTILSMNKKYLYKLVYDLCDCDVDYQTVDELKRSVFHCSNDKIVNDFIQDLNPKLLNVIFFKLKKYKTFDSLVKKVNMFAFLTLYLNLNSFEISFWSLLAYSLNDKTNKSLFFDLIQKYSCMLDQNDFSLREFETLKVSKDKPNAVGDIVHKLILCDKKDYAFNVLVEASSNNDEEYLNNSYKYE